MGVNVIENVDDNERRIKKKKKKEKKKELSPILRMSPQTYTYEDAYSSKTPKQKRKVKKNLISIEDETNEKEERNPFSESVVLSEHSSDNEAVFKKNEPSPVLQRPPQTYEDAYSSKSPSKQKRKVKIDVVSSEDETNVNEKRNPFSVSAILNDHSSDEENIKRIKKAKKRYTEGHKSLKIDISDEEDVHIPLVEIDEPLDEEVAINDDVNEPKGSLDFYDGWTKEDLQELFRRIAQAIPKNDTLKYNSRSPKLNWEQIKFGSYSAKECFDKWKVIEKKIRGYRILSELVADAHSWLEKPWTDFYQSVKKNRHPSMPKRPLSSFMLFYMDKKKKYAKKYPNLEMSKLSKLMAEKFNKLPEFKKEKYNALATEMREEYNEKMQKFLKEHPDEAKVIKSSSLAKKPITARPGPPKPLTPFKMFYQDKLKQLEGSKLQTNPTVLYQECRFKWDTMSSKKKIPWVRWAHEAELKYLDEIKLYQAENPNFEVPHYKSVLTKKEKELLQRTEGKPEKPPNSAYSLFSRIMLKDPQLKVKFETPKERMQEIARLWKEVPKIQKDEYAEKVKHLLENYKLEYATYLDSLPEEKRIEELASTMPKKKTKSDGEQPSKKLKQTSIKEFKDLAAKKEADKKIKSLEELIKMEPVHPPEDPFILFKDEYLTKGLSEKKAVKAWKSLSEMEKAKYEQQIDKLKKEYITNFREFLTSLKPEELFTYKDYKAKLQKQGPDDEESEDDDKDGSSDDDSGSSTKSSDTSGGEEEGADSDD